MKTLILGGARSGKSRLAQQMAIDTGLDVVYLATATADDEEMAERILIHQANRPSNWQLLEEPISLVTTLQQHSTPKNCILVDCLTLWLSNLLAKSSDHKYISAHRNTLCESLAQIPGEIIFVSNEVGQGIIPMGELTRRFVDEAGFLHQALAQHCDQVIMTIAGLAQFLKKPD